MALYKSISETEGNVDFGHKELKVIMLAQYVKINLYVTLDHVLQKRPHQFMEGMDKVAENMIMEN